MSMPSDQQQLYEQDQGEQELEARSSSLYHQKQQRQENDRQLDTARSSSLPAANGVLANGSVPTSPEPLTTASLTPRISSSPGLQAQGQYHQAPSQQQLQQLNGFTEAGSSQHHQDSLFAPPGPSRYSSLPSARRIAPVPSNMATEIGSAAAAAGGPGGFPLGERTDGRMDDAGPSSFPGVQNGSSPSRGGLSISSGPIGPPPSAPPPLPPSDLTSQPLPPRPRTSPASRPAPPPPPPQVPPPVPLDMTRTASEVSSSGASYAPRRQGPHPYLGVSPRKSSLPLWDESSPLESDAPSTSPHASTSFASGSTVAGAGSSRSFSSLPGHAAASSTSTTATTTRPSSGKPSSSSGRIPSRVLLQTALELAQRAVEYDRTNDVPRALAMYRDAVVRLRSVMQRVGIDLGPLPEGLGLPEPTLAEQEELARAQSSRRAKQQQNGVGSGSGTGRSEEEGRTLKGIHDAYIARIGLLCVMQASPPPSATLSQGEFSSDLSSAGGNGGTATSSASRPQSSRSRKSSLGDQERGLGSQVGTSTFPTNPVGPDGLTAAAHDALLARDAKRLSKDLLDEVHGTTRSAAGSIASSDASSSRRVTNEIDDLYPPPFSTPPKPRPRVTSLGRNPASSESVTLHDVLAGGPSPSRIDKALPGTPFEAIQETESRTPRGEIFTSPSSLPPKSLSRSSSLEDDNASLPPPPNGMLQHGRQKSIGQRSHRSISSILETNEEDATLQPGDLRSNRAGGGLGMTVDVQRAQQSFESPRRFTGGLPRPYSGGPTAGNRRQGSDTPPPLPTPSSGMLTPGVIDIDGLSQHSSQTLMLPPPPQGRSRSPQPSPEAERPPAVQARRPFHLMRLLQTTIVQPHGGFLSDRLHIPQAIWAQAGVKLPGLETKTRVLELLIVHIAGLSQTGNRLLQLQDLSPEDANVMEAIARDFARDLDEFEVLLDEMQKLLSKKLGTATVALKAKKSGSSGGISGFGSRLTKTLDKMTNGKTLDSPTAYTDALCKLCIDAQKLDHHLSCLTGPDSSAYNLLNAQHRSHIETRLRRSSDFFGNVILPFVLQDVNVLLSKYLKQSSRWLNDE